MIGAQLSDAIVILSSLNVIAGELGSNKIIKDEL
jgi:hypothetical protein